MRNETVVIYLTPRDKRLLEQASRAANRSLSSFALNAILDVLAAQSEQGPSDGSCGESPPAVGAGNRIELPAPVMPEVTAAVVRFDAIQAQLLERLQRIELAAAAAHAAGCLAAAASQQHNEVGSQAYRECLSMTLDGANAMLSSPPFAAALRAMANSR